MSKNNTRLSRIAQEQRTVEQMIRLYCRKKRATKNSARNASNYWSMPAYACPAARLAKKRALAGSAPFIATSLP